MDEKRTLEQIKKIRAAQERVPGSGCWRASKSTSGKMARSISTDEVLAELDVVVASVHSYMNLDRAEMTERILAAIENPYTQIIAHPTGRLVLRREAFDYDMEKVLDACAQARRGHGVQRLSRPARPVRRAPAAGQAARRENRHLDRLALNAATCSA